MTKSLFYLLLAGVIIFTGCDGITEDVIETEHNTLDIAYFSSPSSFLYNSADSTFTIRANVKGLPSGASLKADVISEDGEDLVISGAALKDDGRVSSSGDETEGDNVYTAIIPMSESFPTQRYEIRYFYEYDGRTEKIGLRYFDYNNGSENPAPVIENVDMPSSVTVTDTTNIPIFVTVADSNGLGDIDRVWFTSMLEGNNVESTPIELYDNGESGYGDETAGDGVYSRIITVHQNNQKGTYTFTFRARDKGKKISDIVTHEIEIK